MDKRYQIFISSTFADLKEEREKVMKTILDLDCFPAGMEFFPAMDEEQFEYIKKVIDKSDYYLLIIGGRYGSVDKKKVSYTEKEFDYAVSQHIPMMVFDLRQDAFESLPRNKSELDPLKLQKLKKFKEKARKRLIKEWSTTEELISGVSTSLQQVIKSKPRPGWVRADLGNNSDSQKIIERLNKDIEWNKSEINRLESKIKGLEADLKNKDDLKSKYQTAQQEIENQKKQIEALVDKLERHQPSSATTTTTSKSQPQTEIFTIPGTDVSFKMIHVEGGTFRMGANEGDTVAYGEEKPAHEVTLSDYWMGETQVTQALWEAVMGNNPSEFKGDRNLPVESVSWLDCKEFIRKLNKLTGRRFRLPKEAQWEFAARGGNLGKNNQYLYAGSFDLFDVAWYNENSKGKTHPVGELDPNELGFYDMTGNVWEWCNDWYDGDFYSNSPTYNPSGPTSGSKRVCRGGCWDNDTRSYRVSYRGCDTPTSADRYLGLRLAL